MVQDSAKSPDSAHTHCNVLIINNNGEILFITITHTITLICWLMSIETVQVKTRKTVSFERFQDNFIILDCNKVP